MQPLSGNQRPDLLTALMNMSLVLRLPWKMHLCRSSSNVPRLLSFLEMLQNPHGFLTFDKVRIPCACHAKRHLNFQKLSEHVGACNMLTSKCASHHHKGVHFFDMSTSKSGPELVCFVHSDFHMCFAPHRLISTSKRGPRMVCFVHFDFQTCFAPQRRALFRHLNFQKSSEHEVFCAL